MKIGVLRSATRLLLGAGFLLPFVGVPAMAEEPTDSRYVTITISGKLKDPDTGNPMVGSHVVLTSPATGDRDATTNEQGEFTIEGLPYGVYSVAITTAEGDEIKGANLLPLNEGSARVDMRISKHLPSQTQLENEPDRFLFVVTKERSNWKRFWKEFGAFFGVAAVAGAAAL